MSGPLLRDKELFLFDLDGVFYKGKERREKIGGTDVVSALRKAGRKLFVLTNNSTDSVETIRSRLAQFDIDVAKGEILTSSLLTAEYLKKRYGAVSYFLIGERGLDTEMRRCGHRASDTHARFIVVGLDRRLSYRKLDLAAKLVREGAAIVATHSSRVYMYSDGPAIATGPVVKALEYATQRRATVIGKPSPLMFRLALRRAACDRSKAVMVGDQVDTDIEGARRAGIDSILVTSGVDSDSHGLAIATLSNVDEVARLI